MVDRGCWVIDIETLSNFFSYVGINIDTKEGVEFIVHEFRNDLVDLMDHLTDCRGHITFNGLGFDYPVIHWIIENCDELSRKPGDEIAKLIYSEAQRIIEAQSFSSFNEYKNTIPEWEHHITQLDLFKLNHFDNKAKLTSLKALEFWMNYPNVQDMPISHSDEVAEGQIPMILEYNLNDVEATLAFYELCVDKVELRKKLSKEYGLKLRNANEPKIGSEIFLELLSKDMKVDKKELRKLRTKRSSIRVNEVLLDYIRFKSDEFNSLLDKFRQTEIIDTKESFNSSVIYKGFKYDFGLGGIHGCVIPGVYKKEGDYIIHDIDVSSFYPNLAIVNGFRPEHLGKSFNRIYKDVYDQRKLIPKKDPKNAAFKLMLNGVYGKSNDVHSYLYDPKFTMQITINGQLLIAMLTEKIVDSIDCQVLQVNTDGLTIKYDKKYSHNIEQICDKWCKLTGLELEYKLYKQMIIQDVNNYLGVYEDDSIKYKGLFEVEKEPYKDTSFKIIPIAISEYYVKGIPIEDTIRNHTNIYNFCGRQKFKSDSYGETRFLDYDSKSLPIERSEKQQKTTRYYISTNGSLFIKVYPKKNKESVINKDYLVTIFNRYIERPMSEYTINYSFYIAETRKIISSISNHNQVDLYDMIKSVTSKAA